MRLATFLAISVPLAIQYFVGVWRQADYNAALQDLTPPGAPVPVYDFIVVGGGSAGCIVAGRLSEAGHSVLLLEAGGSPPPEAAVPGYVNEVQNAPEINYWFASTPQADGGLDSGRVFNNSQGRMLGGSGSHNHMLHNRGHPRDFEAWGQITGDPSWRYDALLPYFKKYENFIGVLFDREPGAAKAYGRSGPISVDTFVNPLLSIWLQAGQELGYPVADPNANQRPSFGPLQVTISAVGRRASSYAGFIEPYEKSRANLKVLRYSDVQEILLEGSRPFGVAYTRHGIPQQAHARKEVILSAGSIRSPLLLMKSGIGPRDVLEEAGIPMRVELPGVGRNFQDHIAAGLWPIFLNDSALVAPSGLGSARETAQALLVSSRARAAGEGDWPDIQLTTMPGQEPDDKGRSFLSLFVVNGRPRQRGSLRLNGTAWRAGERDDQQLAVIDPRMFSDPTDVEVIAEGLELGLRVLENTTAFQATGVGALYGGEPHKECTEHEWRSRDYWRCYVRRTGMSWNHAVGTCSMGRGGLAVVDSKLKVIGVEGLRVIDASVMPVLPNGNTNAPTMMVAEKGAAEILLIHGVRPQALLRKGATYP